MAVSWGRSECERERERGMDGSRGGRHSRTALVVSLALGFAALLTQCHLVLDDVDPSHSRRDASGGGSGGASTGTGGTAATTTCSKDGVHRCDGTSLEVCESGSYKPVASCGSPEQCDAEHGVCLDCAPGAARCSSWRVETCTNSGGQQGWELEVECSTPELCDVTSRGCLVCAKEAAFCNGSLLYLCTDDQRDWNVTDCKEVRLCNARAKECVPCTPGEYQCNGTSLQRCDDTQNWVVLDECVTSELCQATLTSRSNDPTGFDDQCVPPGCTLGQFRCSPTDGAQIEGCPGSQLGWEPIAGEHCLTAALCNPVTGHCDPGCVPGTYRCSSERLEVCKLDGTGFQLVKACTTAAYCNAAKRDCVPCVEGEYQCSGATLQRCNANQTWATKEVCQSEALCLAGGTACKAPVCKLGEFRCNNGKELQICAANRNGWETRDNCVTAALCDPLNGRCNSPECAAGESRCFQNAYQVCDATTRKWGAAQKCASTELCTTVGTDHCIDGCPTPNLQCSGSTLQRCNLVANTETGNNEAKWNETVAVCATAALCSVTAGGCIAPTCEPKTYTCTNNVLRTCNADQTGYDAVATCTSSQICDAAGHQCDACAANSYSCSATTLRQCATDGQSWKDAMVCDAASLCYAAGALGYCHFCDLGDAQCMSGVALSQCEVSTSGQRIWGTSSACDLNVCQDGAGNSDYCVGCAIAGESQCVQTSSPGSLRTCPTDRRQWSTASACTAGYGCVNAGTDDYCAEACVPNEVACVGATGVHSCSSSGSGWSATVSECADETGLKACTSGKLGGRVACPDETPLCVDGACVACTGTGSECVDADTSRTCVKGVWVPTECVAPTAVCAPSTGLCVQCTGTVSSCQGNVRRFCDGNAWNTETCSGTTPVCDGGACVACRVPADCGTGETCDLVSGACVPDATAASL
jgi:hypothetical protein